MKFYRTTIRMNMDSDYIQQIDDELDQIFYLMSNTGRNYDSTKWSVNHFAAPNHLYAQEYVIHRLVFFSPCKWKDGKEQYVWHIENGGIIVTLQEYEVEDIPSTDYYEKYREELNKKEVKQRLGDAYYQSIEGEWRKPDNILNFIVRPVFEVEEIAKMTNSFYSDWGDGIPC